MGNIKKMGRVIFFIFMMCFALEANEGASLDLEYFSKLKEITELEKDENLIVLFQANGNCQKCYTIPMNTIYSLVRDSVLKECRLVALVRCDRDLEVKIFTKKYKWEHYVDRDDGTARKKLGAGNKTSIMVFDFDGKLLKSIDRQY